MFNLYQITEKDEEVQSGKSSDKKSISGKIDQKDTAPNTKKKESSDTSN